MQHEARAVFPPLLHAYYGAAQDNKAAGGIPMASNLPLCYVGSYDAYRQALGDGTEPEEICDALAARRPACSSR